MAGHIVCLLLDLRAAGAVRIEINVCARCISYIVMANVRHGRSVPRASGGVGGSFSCIALA